MYMDKKFVLLGFVFLFALPCAFASDGDENAVKACLAHWGKHPFNEKNLSFKTLSAKVTVLGIGGATRDDEVTEKPALILIKPNVAVLSKAELKLNNPQGWYCLKGQVAVLGKSEVQLNCSAHLAASNDGATVLGGSDTDHGVTVLGSSRLTWTGNCSSKKGKE
jgi:hypothetical protein